MTNRASNLGLIWASSGTATDPDLDTAHPIYQKDKYIKGWIVEKEPHEWQNFLYQITDQKLQIAAQEQFFEWESDISYAPYAVVRSSGKFYINASGETSTNVQPDSAANIWLELLSTDSAGINLARNTLQQLLDSHLSADNPHKDNIHDIGGYEASEITDFLADDSDPRTIRYHVKQTGKVHNETPKQLGTLSASDGGKFTGDINFIGGVDLKSGNVVVDSSSVKIGNSSGALYLNDNSLKQGFSSSSDRFEVTTSANIIWQQSTVNFLFALPVPRAQLDFRNSFSSMSVGSYRIEGSSDPTMSYKGWQVADGFSIYNINYNVPQTYLIEYYSNDSFVKTVVDSSDNIYDGADLKSLFNKLVPSATHIRMAVVYPQLNKYQKSSLLSL